MLTPLEVSGPQTSCSDITHFTHPNPTQAVPVGRRLLDTIAVVSLARDLFLLLLLLFFCEWGEQHRVRRAQGHWGQGEVQGMGGEDV